ncbi:MAG: (2Fe-2S)-binding protein [Thermoproteales archaeon]|nr:(2Fe-2S)-binding protein [Thermoproteales archaeon]
MRKQRVRVDPEKCRSCLVCVTVNACRSPERCIGCLACFWACPYEARVVEEVEEEVGEVTIYVDGVAHRVPDGVTVARALESIGYSFREPGHEPSLACRTGGCWSCALVIDGELERTCITPVRDGMRISTDLAGVTPRRARGHRAPAGWGLGLSAWPPSCWGPAPHLARAQGPATPPGGRGAVRPLVHQAWSWGSLHVAPSGSGCSWALQCRGSLLPWLAAALPC